MEVTRGNSHRPRQVGTPNPTVVNDPSNWRHRALCRFLGVEVFFSPDHETQGEKTRRERVARNICAACPVQDICREDAITRQEAYGIWGGITEKERRAK